MAARLLLAIALVASIWPFVGNGAAQACSCAITTAAERVAMARSVVLGTVVRIDQIDVEPGAFTQLYDVRVDVKEYLKGSGPDQVVVQTPSLSSAACSPFDSDSVDQDFLLYISNWQGQLRTSTCAGSGRIGDSEQSQEYVAEIRDIATSLIDEPLPVWATAASFGAAVLLGGALLLGVRRLRGG